MAGFLQVDIDVLSKSVDSLRNSEQVLNDARKAMADISGSSIGTKMLDDAADSFQRRWQFGVQRIGEAAKVTADGIAQCRDAYQEVDQSIGDALKQTTGSVGQGNPPVPSS